MEALAGLGLAGNVVQFVQFATTLISAGVEISDSLQGATRQIVELEKIYTRLSVFTSELRKPKSDACSDTYLQRLAASLSSVSQESDLELQTHIQSLEDLADDCKLVCGQLLDVLRALRVDGSSRRPFKSFMAALKTAWSSKRIQALEDTLRRFQSVISLHFFPLLRYNSP